MNKYILILIVCIPMLFSCKKDEAPQDDKNWEIKENANDKNYVKTHKLINDTFNHELISNGKLMAKHKADLKFQSTELIQQILVKNGDKVKKGQVIAKLDKFRAEQRYKAAVEQLERARIELHDVLIGQGYAMGDTTKVPAKIMRIAKIKSGFERSQNELVSAKHELDQMVLIAPFSGTVANLFAKEYNNASPGEVFCTVFDHSTLEVSFTVLENELSVLRNGDQVVVNTYSGVSSAIPGKIFEINPIVDQTGMVRVKALVAGGHSDLYDGMNVKINVRRSMDKQLLLPKEAVVIRGGKQVVFTLKNGKANWNYVKTNLENSKYYTISDGLKPGDQVIVSGNLNLAHDTPVVLMTN